MLPLSIALACKDNREHIPRLLDSVRGLASQIVAADSGSTDGTIDLLDKAGARVIRTDWLGYKATKQLAIDACTSPWVLLLDSDESLEPDLAASIRRFLELDDPAIAGAELNRVVWYRGRFLRHAWQPEWRLRLFRRGRGRCAGYDPHDFIEITGEGATRIQRIEGTLRHDSFPSFEAHLRKQASHAITAAESLARQGRRGRRRDLLLSPPGAFLKQLILKSAWRDGAPGWLAAGSAAAGALMKHVALIEKTRQK